jgi:hypothetical protein
LFSHQDVIHAGDDALQAVKYMVRSDLMHTIKIDERLSDGRCMLAPVLYPIKLTMGIVNVTVTAYATPSVPARPRPRVMYASRRKWTRPIADSRGAVHYAQVVPSTSSRSRRISPLSPFAGDSEHSAGLTLPVLDGLSERNEFRPRQLHIIAQLPGRKGLFY